MPELTLFAPPLLANIPSFDTGNHPPPKKKIYIYICLCIYIYILRDKFGLSIPQEKPRIGEGRAGL